MTVLFTGYLGFVVGQLVKNPSAMWEMVQFLGWKNPLRRERLPTPVFWPGEFHELYSPWGCKESDTTEQLSRSLEYSKESTILEVPRGDPLYPGEHGAARGAEVAGRGRQPARHLGITWALLAAALGTVGGCFSSAAHRPRSAVGAEIHRKTRMGYNRKRCWNTRTQQFCTGSFGKCLP